MTMRKERTSANPGQPIDPLLHRLVHDSGFVQVSCLDGNGNNHTPPHDLVHDNLIGNDMEHQEGGE